MTRLWLAVLVLATAGCGDDGPKPVKHDAGTADAPDVSFGTYVPLKFPAGTTLSGVVTLPTIVIDTNTSSMCDKTNDHADTYCAIIGATITLGAGATFTATGDKPLILLASQSIDLEGTLDVSSRLSPAQLGAGHRTTCTGATEATGSSGGYGGSFGGKGGAGGAIGAGTAGAAAPAAAPAAHDLLGGCPGGTGGAGTAGASGGGGTGGAGGGAVVLSAPAITFNGIIDASGAGGTGGPMAAASTGAGGGGSGGMIVLEGTVTPGTASMLYLFANGGGGGQGGTATGAGAGAGSNGQDPAAPNTAALGGNSGAVLGGPGGNGAAGVRPDGGNGSTGGANAGGGAGGGGAGAVHTPSISGATISPLAT